MDPLSDMLSMLKLKSYVSASLDLGGKWSLQFQRHQGIKCYTVISGTCWLTVEGVTPAVRLKAGECFVLPRGRPFRLASDLGLASADPRSFHPGPWNGCVVPVNGGGDAYIAGSHFQLDGNHAGNLLSILPPILHITEEADQKTLHWSMEWIRQELHDPQPGGLLIAENFAHVLLVQVLRRYLADGVRGGIGWLSALADKQIGKAICAIHADPARHWTLKALAEQAGMSRSSFALKFKEIVGETAMEYLTRWRMMLASDQLTSATGPITVIALSLGYECENAFSTAFKRVVGCSPRQYRSGLRRVPQRLASSSPHLQKA